MRTTDDLLTVLTWMTEELSSPEEDALGPFHAAAGICKEAGELLGIEDKVAFQDHALDDIKICAEVGDILAYLLRYLDMRSIPLRECLVAVIAKLRARYPQGVYAPQSTLNRDRDAERDAVVCAVTRDRLECGG